MDKQFLIDLAIFVAVFIGAIWIVGRPYKKGKNK